MRTRIILAGTDIDLLDDVSMPLNYAIADIREPDKKNSFFSKEITLPGTPLNDSMFGYLNDVSVTVQNSGTTQYAPSFNPNFKANVQILFDGTEVFSGFLKLERITKADHLYKHDFVVTVYGQLVNWFFSMGDQTLADLDLSKYNHTYNKTEQVNSRATSIKVNGVTTPFVKGVGYAYPMIDYGLNNDIDYNVNHFFPAVGVPTIVQEIASQNGFQLDGDLLTDEIYNSLYVPFTGGSVSMSASQILDRTHRASNTSTIYNYSSGTFNYSVILFTDDTTAPNHDAGGVYNPATGYFTCAVNGSYKLTFGINVSATHFPIASPATLKSSQTLGYFRIFRNGNGIASKTIQMFNNTAFGASTSINLYDTSPVTSGASTASVASEMTVYVNLNAGDIINCDFQDVFLVSTATSAYNEAHPTSRTRVNLLSDSYFRSELNLTAVTEGDTVDMSTVLPNTVKQRDFISSIFKRFNVYAEQDKSIANKLILQPRNNFYLSGTTREWSDKLDYSATHEVVPMGLLDFKSYLWKDKDDADYYNSIYKNKRGETYGQREYTITNDFIKEQKVAETIFSPTPLANRANSDRVIPRIWALNNANQITPKTANIRLLYYGGVKTTTDPYNYITTSGTTVETQYLYMGHLDDTDTPTVDINFGVPNEVYFTAQNYTDNNMFNIYYKEFIDQITDKDSKMFKGRFHITPYDIAILDFRDLFFFEGQYWILNKIIDYNPIEVRSTQCEFISLKKGVPFESTSVRVYGGGGVQLGVENVPEYTDTQRVGGNNRNNNQLTSGENNIIADSAYGVIVTGSNNSVGEGARNISLLNSSGCTVPAYVQNITAIGCTDIPFDVRYEGLTVINNHIVGAKRLLNKTATYTGEPEDLGHMIIFNLSADVIYYLPNPNDIYNGWSVEIKNKTNAGYAVTVTITNGATSPFFEDGVSTTDIVNSSESFTYTYRSNIWYIT